MSLYGSGRREGVIAAIALACVAMLVHTLGSMTGLSDGYEGDQTLASGMATAHGLAAIGEPLLWDPMGSGAPLWTRGAELLYPPWWLLGRGQDAYWLPLLAALHSALACALGFRFLRAQGRSRYAAFVAGAAYGLGAHMGSLSGHLAEVAAIAWAPLPIEVFLRYARSERNRMLGACLAPALALPFITGGTVTATCVTATIVLWLVRRALHDPSRRMSMFATGTASAAVLLLLTAPIWLCQADAPGVPVDLPPPPDLLGALQRVAGPLLPFFTALGLMRHQRHTPAERWLPIGLLGIGIAVLLPLVPSPFAGPAPWQETPEALWWPLHLALVVLGASGLDDFLDQPLRRRAATVWLLVASASIAPLGFLLGADTHRFHVEATVLLALSLLFTCWRWLGILGFKTVLAAAAVCWLATSTLQEQAGATRTPRPVAALPSAQTGLKTPAMPGIESAAPRRSDPRAHIVFAMTRSYAPLGLPILLPRVKKPLLAVIGLPDDFVCLADENARVQRVADGSTHEEFVAELGNGQGALLIDETFARGWCAFVDGQSHALLRTDDGARVILLGKGTHRVAMFYRPMVATLGMRFAALGLLIALAFMLACAVRTLHSDKN